VFHDCVCSFDTPNRYLQAFYEEPSDGTRTVDPSLPFLFRRGKRGHGPGQGSHERRASARDLAPRSNPRVARTHFVRVSFAWGVCCACNGRGEPLLCRAQVAEIHARRSRGEAVRGERRGRRAGEEHRELPVDASWHKRDARRHRVRMVPIPRVDAHVLAAVRSAFPSAVTGRVRQIYVESPTRRQPSRHVRARPTALLVCASGDRACAGYVSVGARRSLADLQFAGDLLVAVPAAWRRRISVRASSGLRSLLRAARRGATVSGRGRLRNSSGSSPRWAARIAAESSSASESLRRYPEAPASRAA
jgi:hypothetical protein